MNLITGTLAAGFLGAWLHAHGMGPNAVAMLVGGTEVDCPSTAFTVIQVGSPLTGPAGAVATTIAQAKRLALDNLKEALIEEYEVTCGPCVTNEINPDAECELTLDIPSYGITYLPITGSGQWQFSAQVDAATRVKFWCNETESCPPLP